MRAPRLLSLFLLIVATLPAAAAQGRRFVQYPDIRGDQILFTYEDDLWRVSQQGGDAVRLTTHPGREFAGRFSPDGKWIAFSASYDSGVNVYVMPAAGGAPKRLTWNGYCQVLGWTPDSARVLYRSAADVTFRPVETLFTVAVGGGSPVRESVPRGVQGCISADGKQLLYSPRGREEYYWKRYKGGQYQEIWLHERGTLQFRRLTDYVGKNAYPMWAGGKACFVSDRGPNGVANIYSLDVAAGRADALTAYTDFDVQMASTDGKRIVFLQAGFLKVLDPGTGKVADVNVGIPTDSWVVRDRTVAGKDFIQNYTVSNDGRTAVLDVRGEVFLAPTDGAKAPVNVSESPASRERFPRLSPDGRSVAFFSDRSGEYELYVKPASPGGEWVRLTSGPATTYYHPEWSPDGKKILFGSKDLAIFVADVEKRTAVKIAESNQLKNDEFYWEVSDYSWSPDSRWVAFSLVQYNRNNQVFLYNLESGKTWPVTDGFHDCVNPSFGPEGDCLYFLAHSNFNVTMDLFEDNHVISNPVSVMAALLKDGASSPFEGDKPAAEPEPKGEGAGKPAAEPPPLSLDPEGIGRRLVRVPVDPGNYFYLRAGKGYLTWASVDNWDGGEFEELFRPLGDAKWTLHLYDTAGRKDTALPAKISYWTVSPNGQHCLVKAGKNYFAAPLAKAAREKSLGEAMGLDKLYCSVNAQLEWKQIFEDTWRWYRDFFYDANMHGVDWKAVGDKFRAWLPDLTSRADLNWLLSQMVGELCVSHTYVYGGDNGPRKMPERPAFTGLLGADLEPGPQNTMVFRRIFGPTAAAPGLTSPLSRQGLKVREGNYLLAVNGVTLAAGRDLYELLQVTPGKKVTLTVNDKPAPEGAWTIEVEPVANDGDLRYERWVADNMAFVEKASHGEFGYMHINAMDEENIGRFDRFWRAYRYRKGLIIDVRGNGGGWTEYFMIDKLERRMIAQNVLRGMAPFRYPGSTTTARLVVLTNEYNGSDGEGFIEHFKAEKLGTVVGVPSWGGLVGIINTQYTVDGGQVEQSNNAFYGSTGTWWVENHGADPDVVVENDPVSAMQGRDMQLEKGVEVLKEQVKAQPWSFPAPPAYPKR